MGTDTSCYRDFGPANAEMCTGGSIKKKQIQGRIQLPNRSSKFKNQEEQNDNQNPDHVAEFYYSESWSM